MALGISQVRIFQDMIEAGLLNQQLSSRAVSRGPLEQNFSYRWQAGERRNNQEGLPLVLKENPSNSDLNQAQDLKYGVPSFINPYALLSFPSQWGSSSEYNTLIDDPNSARKFTSPEFISGNQSLKNTEPTAYNLVNSPPDGSGDYFKAKTPYRYTDFIYCKYYGIIPNNYLITLRRFPAPTFDNLGIPLEATDANKDYNFKPIAQAVTWLGEETENKISEILGFEVSMNWKSFEAQVESVQGNEQSADQGPFSQASKFLTIFSGALGGQVNSASQQANSNYDPYANGPYSHRVYGPVNVISKTYKRDRGLDFKQSFNITFHYSLKSIAGINPKVAMLDIMSNMMQLTYNNAAFWGGANRYFAQKPVFPFIGGKAGMNAWYRGDPVGFTKAVSTQINGVMDQIGKFFEALSEDPISALKKLATDGASTAMKVIGQGKAPDIVALKALLTGEPIGEWHMVVGNPYHPMLKIGNLICTGAKFQFNDTLGADNFPTELKVTVSLEHGRPRDKGDIESMFNQGEGRIYFAPLGKSDAFRSSSMYNSDNDTGQKGSNPFDATQQTKTTSTTPPSTSSTRTGSGASKKTKGRSSDKSTQVNTATVSANKKTPNVGNTSFDQIVDNLAYPFTNSGHDLAIRMGLASAGTYKKGSPTTGNVANPNKPAGS